LLEPVIAGRLASNNSSYHVVGQATDNNEDLSFLRPPVAEFKPPSKCPYWLEHLRAYPGR